MYALYVVVAIIIIIFIIMEDTEVNLPSGH